MAKSLRRQIKANEREQKRLSKSKEHTRSADKRKSIDGEIERLDSQWRELNMLRPEIAFITVDSDEFNEAMKSVKPLKSKTEKFLEDLEVL
tara:strand:+ start:82 stop:354 length:273 start_codon:yes stop_codon:yes gene_type:complete